MVDTRQKPQTRPIPIIEKKEQKSQKKIDKTAKISGDQEIVRLFVYKNRIYYNEGLDKKLSIAISKSTYIPNEIADIEIGVEGAKAPLVATKGQGIGILENSRKESIERGDVIYLKLRGDSTLANDLSLVLNASTKDIKYQVTTYFQGKVSKKYHSRYSVFSTSEDDNFDRIEIKGMGGKFKIKSVKMHKSKYEMM